MHVQPTTTAGQAASFSFLVWKVSTFEPEFAGTLRLLSHHQQLPSIWMCNPLPRADLRSQITLGLARCCYYILPVRSSRCELKPSKLSQLTVGTGKKTVCKQPCESASMNSASYCLQAAKSTQGSGWREAVQFGPSADVPMP